MGFRELFNSAYYPLFFLLFAHRTYCVIVHQTLFLAPADARDNIERMYWDTQKMAFANDGSLVLLDAAQPLFYSPLSNWRNEGIGRAQNLIEFNWLMNQYPSMGIDPVMLVYGVAHLLNQPVVVVNGNDFVLDIDTQLHIPKDDNLRRCSRAYADGEARLYFLTYSLNVPQGNPGAGLPLSYIIVCQDAINWADRPGENWLWWPQTVYDTISVRLTTLGRNLRDVHIDYLVCPYFFFLKAIIRTPQVFGAGTPVGDAVSWSDCTNVPNPLNPGCVAFYAVAVVLHTKGWATDGNGNLTRIPGY